MKQQMQLFSIFGQIEKVVAEQFIAEGRARKIECDLIPDTVRYNDKGEPAWFAIAIPSQYVHEFDQAILNLRA